MTDVPPDIRSEVDIVTVDPLFLEKQRNRYASRAVGYVVLLNGVAALVLLIGLTQPISHVADHTDSYNAMMLFGGGAVAALASSFFAYLRRTITILRPERVPLRTFLWWLSILAAVGGAACFIVGLHLAGVAALPEGDPA
jgi:hypothetical protein